MTMITPSYLGETIEYSSLHACRSTLEDPTALIAQEQACLVNAGMDSATALTTATSDVTAVLIAAKADPSQSTGLPRLPSASSIPTWVWLAGAGVIGLIAISAVKR